MIAKNLYTVIYIAAALICVCISVYLSYWGYYSHLQELTFLFAALIGILLFGSDLLIRHMKIAQKSLVFPLLFFTLVAAFSGASNFNFLYTNFMQEDIAQRTVREQFDIFREDLTQTRRTLLSRPAYQQVSGSRAELQAELENLRDQLNDPLRPGCGERCRAHIRNIHEMLGGAPTDLAIPDPGAGEAVVNTWYENFSNAVLADFERRATRGSYTAIRAVVHQIDQLLVQYSDPDGALRAELAGRPAALIRGEGLQLISELRQYSVEIARQANAVVPADEPIQHRPITSDLDKIGEIPVSFKDGFVDRPNAGVTIVSLFVAVFVDLAPVLFALVLFNAKITSNNVRPGQRQRRSGGRVAT